MAGVFPPLSALRVFESAARHLNFTRAAAELGMTQAAVSYQIKVLEERIGAPLFIRKPKRLALTDTGERLAPGILEAFEIMRASVAATRDQASATLTISTMQTFASNWLVHRIGDFQTRHPNIAVRFDVSNGLADFAGDGIDVGIRSGAGKWPRLVAHKLLQARFTPLVAPEIAAAIREPADLFKLRILDAHDPWWRQWFAAAGIDYAPDEAEPRLLLDSQAMVANLASAGQGAAILTPAFFQTEIARGVLVQPFDLVCGSDVAYWLVYPESRRAAPHIRAFRDWITKALSGEA